MCSARSARSAPVDSRFLFAIQTPKKEEDAKDSRAQLLVFLCFFFCSIARAHELHNALLLLPNPSLYPNLLNWKEKRERERRTPIYLCSRSSPSSIHPHPRPTHAIPNTQPPNQPPQSSTLELANRRRLRPVQRRLVAKQLPDVADAVLDHGRALEGEPPSDDPHPFGEAHGAEHFGAEDARVADLGPPVLYCVVWWVGGCVEWGWLVVGGF